MKIVGVDLAGNPSNDTGLCLLTVDGSKSVKTEILHSDEDILKRIHEIKPDVIAIDAPLIFSGDKRQCDHILREYGTLPVTLRGMEILAIRGANLSKKLEDFKVIEVFATATGKILGLYDKDTRRVQKMLISAGIEGDIGTRFLTRDELDSIFAALTGFLHLDGKTKTVGDAGGEIVVPEV